MPRNGRLTKLVYLSAAFVSVLYLYRLVIGPVPAGDDSGVSEIVVDRPSDSVLQTSKQEYYSHSKKQGWHETLAGTPISFGRGSQLANRKAGALNAVSSKRKTAPNPVCSRPWSTDWNAIERSVQPAINLDGERFLYPLLVNGPNNQLIGLRDSVYLAIRLNRTLILPRFYKHKTDKTAVSGSTSVIPPSQRIDVASLSSLVRVLPYFKIQRVCSNGFDDLYFTSYKAMHSSLTHIVEDVGVPIHTKSSGEAASAYPSDPDPNFNALFNVRSDKKSLNKLYRSPGKCALYVGPYRTVGVKESAAILRKTKKLYLDEKGNILMNVINPDVIPDEELYCLIVHSTPTPKHISAIVSNFMLEYDLEEMAYVSVHWRYDTIDWQVRCKKPKLPKRKEFLIEMCSKIENIQPIDIARAILRYIQKVESLSSYQVKAVYFAAPLNMEKFIEDVETGIDSLLEEEGAQEEFHVFTQSDLRDHLLKYSSCEGLKENYEDIFSQLEMDVCSRATAFLRSPSSSWSKVIKERRVISDLDKYDGNIFDIAWKAAERRLNQ